MGARMAYGYLEVIIPVRRAPRGERVMRRIVFRRQAPRAGFTLIELLIVVAIIAILAAIAAPNFLEAQTRARVGRELSDLRAIGVALESYRIDANAYPPHGEILAAGRVNFPASQAGIGTVEFLPGQPLTTPIAYLSAAPEDPCLRGESLQRRYGYVQTRQMAAILTAKGRIASAVGIEPRYGMWRLYAAGPDGDKGADAKVSILYDPTNGAVSDGDIVRSQRAPVEQLSRDEQ